jgi:2-polyprenyl-3-methyl-5-hydroxy-6-metoxy-1,4-benzoquinol methylase
LSELLLNEKAKYKNLKKPVSKNLTEKYKSCPVCGHVEFDYFLSSKDEYSNTKRKFHVLYCKECSYSFTYLPSDVDPIIFYGEDYKQTKKGLSNFQKRIYSIYYRMFFPLRFFKKGSKILDVGCGNGLLAYFLKYMGFEMTCIEKNGKSAKFTSDNFALEVYNCELEEALLPDNHFDIVLFRHSMEHIPDIASALREVKRILKKDGAIFIETPNIKSKECRIFGSNFYHLDLPRHIHHFSHYSLKKIVEKSDFIVKYLAFDNFMPHSFSMSLVYYLEKLINRKFPCIINKLFCIFFYPLSIAINSFASCSNNGSIIRLLAVKNSNL